VTLSLDERKKRLLLGKRKGGRSPAKKMDAGRKGSDGAGGSPRKKIHVGETQSGGVKGIPGKKTGKKGGGVALQGEDSHGKG